MLKKIFFLLGILSLSSLFIYADISQYTIRSSHTGSITSMDFSEYSKTLITGGEDGVIKVWDIKNGNLKNQIQISNVPIKKLSASDKKPYLAIISGDGINSIDISVWNWKTGKILFSNRLAETPIFIDFSPQANFIVYGKTNWDSLVFLDAESGSILKPIDEGFGIVSSVFITDTEKTLLSYNSSGSLQYWDITSGKRKTKIPTLANIEQTFFSNSGRYMIGFNGNKILLIDLLSGKEIDSISAENIVLSNIDNRSDKFIFSTTTRIETIFTTIGFDGNGFEIVDETKVRDFISPTKIIMNSGITYLSDTEGNIYKKSVLDSKPILFAEDCILKIDDFCINDSYLTITCAGSLFSISTDILSVTDKKDFKDISSETITTLDEDASYGLSKAKEDNILIWESVCKGMGSLSTLNVKNNRITKITDTTPLVSAKLHENKILTLDKNGECRIINYNNGKELFHHSSYGIKTVDFIDEKNIIAGRNTSKTIKTPLLQINTTTGETVPIEDSNLLVFDLRYDSLGKKLYTLGFEERNNSMRTVLKQHSSQNLKKVTTIFSYFGEDINSTFLPDFINTKLFTTIGQSGIKMLYWGGYTSMEEDFSIPINIDANNDFLIALNKDSSFSIYDQSTGNKLMNLYIFKDLSWGIILKNNEYYTKNGAERYFN